ncbi:MAG TPA: phosphoribosylformylglycinamidine cyclo-ligase [Mycobacteriales bacterium]|nr:phosphoribosylformylglycinamidine cyclo-ligase [Mycobacteriales bacterium]
MSSEKGGATYAAAGVDIDAGERAVELMKPWIAKTVRPEVVGGVGGFAGLFELDTTRWRRPLLASSTDGVGTKLAIAQALGRHDTVGQDLVAMVADDVVVCGAEPLFLQDYIACGRVVPERLAEIVSGIAEGCRLAGCALVGGETAEHPGMLGPEEYDIAGTAVGVVEADAVLGPERVRPGDVLVAMGSSGVHSNGFSLIRHVLRDVPLDSVFGDHTLGEELLTPTRIYSRDCLALIEALEVHAFAHVTGGGLAENLVRVLPPTVDAVVDRSSWQPQPIFGFVGERGRVEPEELERTFNLGVGMIAIVAADATDQALAALAAREVPAWIAGEITSGTGRVDLVNSYR